MEVPRNPIGMRQTTRGKSLQLLLYVILHASDRWTGPLHQQVGGAAIAIMRKTNTAGVGDKPFSNLWTWNGSNVGAMNVPVDGNRLAQHPVNRFQLSIGRFWCPELAKDFRDWRAPARSDLESERAAIRAATRSSPLLAWYGSPPASEGSPSKGRAVPTIGSQTPPATRAGKAFHQCCPPQLASRDRECDPQSPRGSRRRLRDHRRRESSRERFVQIRQDCFKRRSIPMNVG